MANINCKDHLGNEFNSKKEMYDYWGINSSTVSIRESCGWSLEKILTTPPETLSEKCKDHLGNEFESKSKMAKHWGLDKNTFSFKRKTGVVFRKNLDHSCTFR